MANYKVGDLDVTISGVSKDAVSSLDEVIKQLDALQGKLGAVSKGFGGAFRGSGRDIRGSTKDIANLTVLLEKVSKSQALFNSETNKGKKNQNQQGNATKTLTEQIEFYQTKIAELSQTLEQLRYEESQQKAAGGVSSVTIDSIKANVAALSDYKNKLKELERTKRQAAMTNKEIILDTFNEENALRKTEIAAYRAALATKKDFEGNKLNAAATREYTHELKERIKAQEEADKLERKMNRVPLKKLVGQIGKIALYRTIRRGLQIVTQSFTETIQDFAQVDENINRTMSQLTSSTKVIQLSFGTMLLPIIQAITPAVQSLSVGFANMANAINKSMALAQGNATYTKINTQALEDYRKQLNKTSGALFDFDKFRALSNKQDTATTFLSTESIDTLDEAESKFSGLFTFISGIGDILVQALRLVWQIVEAASPIIDIVFKIAGWLLKGVGYILDFVNNTGLIEPILYGILTALELIGAAKIITWVKSGGAVKAILSLTKAIATLASTMWTKLIDALEGVNGAFIAWGIAIAAVTAAVKILSNWDDFSKGTRIAITIISGLIAALVTATTWAMALHSTLTMGMAIPLITTAIASGIVFVRGRADIPNYAVGASDIDSGTVFRAGEAGKTEMVYTGDNGKTNVANVQQMYQAEYMAVLQALKDYGAARGEMPQLLPASDTGIYQAAERGAGKVGKGFAYRR